MLSHSCCRSMLSHPCYSLKLSHPCYSPKLSHPCYSPKLSHPCYSPKLSHPCYSPKLSHSCLCNVRHTEAGLRLYRLVITFFSTQTERDRDREGLLQEQVSVTQRCKAVLRLCREYVSDCFLLLSIPHINCNGCFRGNFATDVYRSLSDTEQLCPTVLSPWGIAT